MDRPEILAALALWIAPPPSGGTDELVRWDAPESCPTRAQLEQAIAHDLGRPLAPHDAARVHASASARPRSDRRWELALTIEPRDAPAVARTVVAERCELLADAAALMIAVAIDPDLLVDPPASRVAPTSRQPVDIPLAPDPTDSPPLVPAPRPRAPARDASPARAPDPRPRLRAALQFAAGLDVGALPRPAPGFTLRLGLLARRVRAEVGASHWLAQSAPIAGTSARGDLRLTTAQLMACPRFARRRLELPVCAGLELGAMRGAGVGLAVPTVDRVLWFAVVADARLLWVPVPRLALGLHLGFAAPLLTARFRVDGLDEDLHRAAPIAFRGALAIELRFP